MIYRGGFSIAIENYLESDRWIEYIKVISLIFMKSIAEIAVILSLIYLVACKFIGINQKIVIVSSILFFFFLGVANQLSLLNVRSFLTYDSLLITINWMKDNPDIMTSYLTKRNLVYIILFIVLSFLPIILSNIRIRSILFLWFNRLITSLVILIVALCLLFYFSTEIFLKKNANLKPFDGYWISFASSLIGGNNTSLQKRKVLTVEELKSDYMDLAYIGHNKVERKQKPYIMPFKSSKKHIIIIGLETAPQKYYPIATSTKLKNFYKMSKSSIVSDMHFTSSPYTFYAYYSVLTGTYVPTEGTSIIYGKMSFNGLANILPEYGYIPTYIDSYYTDWHEGDTLERVINRFGFEKIFDRDDYEYETETAAFSNVFDKDLHAETTSFDKIVQSLDDSIMNKKKALVFYSTGLGHFKWKTKNGDENLSNKEKVFELANTMDKLFGKLLVAIKERGLEDDVIIVVIGDHGLRYHEEYTSLNEKDNDIAIAFNVPLMIYLPGQLDKQIKLEHVTSHVDLAPTLLDIVGIDTSKYFFHGENILNPRLKYRSIFQMNQKLKPENSFINKGIFYTYNDLSAESHGSIYIQNKLKRDKIDPEMRKNTEEIIKNAKEFFNNTGAYFLQKNKTSK